MLASLIFPGAAWLLPAAAVVVVGLVILVWSYRHGPSPRIRSLCFGLKLAGIAALAFCLLEPLQTQQRAKPGANLFALVADNSQGLQIHDTGQTQSRGEGLRSLLDPRTGGWQTSLEANFQLRRYLFDTRLQNVRDFSGLDFSGRATALGGALRSLRERFQSQPLAGILLFTDGNATDFTGPLPDLAGLPPIYPVVIGQDDAIKDVSLQRVAVTQSAFEDAPVSAQVDLAAAGFGTEPLLTRIVDRTGKTVIEQGATAHRDGSSSAQRLQWKPEKAGVSFYQIKTGTAAEMLRNATVTNTAEATLANNSRVIAVDRGRGPYRILYVAGRPNWEFRYMNRAAQEDDQLQVVALIRVALREPKFAFRGRAGETSNPLFRGSEDQARETTERYDQPVLTRLYTRDDQELRGGFPRTAEELYAYHAVIVDKLEAEFFSPAQAQLLQKFVSERGGGFLMLGGMESFQQGHYHRTPIGDMLPVYLDRDESAALPGPVHFQLSREGWLQPWARLRDNETDERARVANMPAFDVLNTVRDVKPAASVIASAVDGAGHEHPALAIQRFGRGRTGALLIGDLWRWGSKDSTAHADLDKNWRQLLRWLVTDVPNRVDLSAEPQPEDANGAVRLQIRARDEKFQPLDNAIVSIQVEPVRFDLATGALSNPPVHLTAVASTEEPGLYEATYVPRLTAGFHATATVTNTLGAPAGQAEAGWSTDLAAEEFRSLVPNRPLLEELARRTGGRVIASSSLADLAKELPTHAAPVMESWTQPFWHTPAMFALALTCLLGEWGLRRWKGLP